MTSAEDLEMFERDTTLAPSALRKAGYVPATVYGKTTPAFSIQVKDYDFSRALVHGHTRFRLAGMGKTVEAEVKQLQRHNTKDSLLHAEFYVPAS